MIISTDDWVVESEMLDSGTYGVEVKIFNRMTMWSARELRDALSQVTAHVKRLNSA